MLLTLHDANLNKVAFVDNDKSGTLNYFDDTWTRDLETGSSTFEFSIYKKSLKSDTAYKKAYNYLNERAFVSFVYKGQTYLFNVMTVEEDETTIQCYCENLNLELINEYANPYKAEKSMSFVEYCNAMDLLNMAKLTVGRNEISDYRRTLEWEGQDTKLARLLSLANNFDAEIDFETILNDDSSLKSFKVNIYHENDDTHQGVGRVRSDIRLTYGKNLKSITRKVDKTGIFNMIVPTSSKTVDNDTDSGESSSKTVTTTNADGSITKTTTKKASDGTTVQTKVTTKVVENADGSKVTTVRTEKSDGSITEKVTTKSANGNTDTVTKTIREATKENAETVDEYITIAGLPDWEIKNDDGIVEFYKKGEALYAPISARLYPSTFTTETQSDQWIRHDMSFDVDSDTKLETEALKQLKANAYPALSYTIKGYIDADIGDTLSMSDSGFVPTLLLTARVSNQKLSFTQPSKNETTLANFKALESGLTDDIQSRLEELFESSRPYTIRVASTNGTTFKNNVGESTITATLLKGDKTVSAGVTWRWALDGNVTVGMQYLAKASSINDTAVLTVSAYIGNNEVATTEITLTNVNDGANGAKGEKGDKGETGADGKDGKDGRGLERSEDFYQLTSIGTAPNYPMVGGRNLLRNSKGPFKPDRQGLPNFDNYQSYADSTVYLENGKQYIISAETDGYLTSIHNGAVESDNVVLWIVNPAQSVNKIVSNDKSSTTGSVFTWDRPTGTYCLRVNTYHKTAVKSVWNVQIEQGTTKTPYSQAPEDLGWSTDMKVPTADKRFLWKLHIDYFSDGTVAVTQPTIAGIMGIQGLQGLPGETGADGKTQYTHIAYADNATGGGFSQTDQTKAYIGMYQDFVEAGSNDPTKYLWSKWKGSDGAQGIPGKAGADGKTPYIHFAYADNATGSNFSLTDKNQQYMGYYSDYTQADSTDYTKYKWVDRLANVQVGGRNLAQKTSKDWSTPYTNFKGIANTCPNLYKVLVDGLSVGDTLKSRIVLKYTDIVPTSGQTATIWLQGSGNVSGWNAGSYIGSAKKTLSGSGEVVFEHEFKITADHLKNEYWNWQFRTDYIASGSLQWKLAKVEKGTVFSDWSPALEDTQEQIDSKADDALTQEQLNALAEKNRTLEAELEAKAALATVEAWKEAYDSYVAQNNQDKTEAEQKLITLTNRVAEWVKDWEDKKVQWSFLDTNMDFGAEGLRLGKKGSPTSILISNDRIGFYSGGSEVASMSNGTLTIDNGIFAKSLQIGHFREEVYEGDNTINVIRWVD